MIQPYISVITPVYNCAGFIGQTLSSIHHQAAPAVKHIVVDGGSTDGTIDILEQYRDRLDHLIIEPDDSMYHGIAKGAMHADTEIMAWLNADDVYYPWTFSVVEEVFRTFPQVDWIIGRPSYLNAVGQCINVSSNAGTACPTDYIRNGWFKPDFAGFLQQESMFWRKRLWDKAGGLDLSYRYAADFELWTRFACHADLYSVGVPLAGFRKREGQTSEVMAREYAREVDAACRSLRMPLTLWTKLGRKSNLIRVFLRLLLWKRGQYIVYSETRKAWVIRRTIRPVSRYSFSELLLTWNSR